MQSRFLMMAGLALVTGCSPGVLGTRAFTQDSRYLLWQDFSLCGFLVKRTDCATGRTVTLGKGEFAIDKAGRYVLCYPCSVLEKVPSLVRMEDQAIRTISLWPGGNGPMGDCIIDLSVETFEPVRLTFTDVNTVDKKFAVYSYDKGVWRLVDSGKTNDEQLHAAEQIAQQTQSSPEEWKAGKETRSPDGRHVLVEHAQGIARYSELRRDGGKRTTRLATQTDQAFEGLTKFEEWLIFGKNASWNWGKQSDMLPL